MKKFLSAILALAFVSNASAQTIGGYVPPTGTGTVTSVGVGNITGVTTSGAPVTTNGTVTQTLNSQTANTIFAAPNGSAGTPTFRQLVPSDFPSQTAATFLAAPTGSAGVPSFRVLSGNDLSVTQAGTGGVARTYTSKSADILGAGDYSTVANALAQGVAANSLVTATPTINIGTTCTATTTISSGTYTSATGAVSLTISGWTGTNGVGYTIYVGNLTGTGSFASLQGNRVTTTGSTGTTVNFTGPTGLGAVTITGGQLFGLPGIACTGGNTRAGLTGGNLAIGNQITGIDAFVNLHVDDLAVNSQQEMRGATLTRRYYRTNPDESLLGWDNIPFVAANVVTASNNQNLIGNMKSIVAELYFQGPPAAPYTVRNSYNVQATLVQLDANITLQNWQGVIVSATPTGGGTITTGYGIQIGNITATNAAAIKIDGQGAGGQIKFPNTAIYEDAGSKVTIDFGAQQLLNLINAKTTTTATAGASGALPAQVGGYWSVLIGGVERKIPYYAP